MDNGPFAGIFDPDADGFHFTPTAGPAVTRIFIHMLAPETQRAVVPVRRPWCIDTDDLPAVNAAKVFVTLVLFGATTGVALVGVF